MATRRGDVPGLTADPTLAEEELGFCAKRTSQQFRAISENFRVTHNNVTATIYLLPFMSDLTASESSTHPPRPCMTCLPWCQSQKQRDFVFSANHFAPSGGVGVYGSLTNAPLGAVSSFPVAFTPSKPGTPPIGSVSSIHPTMTTQHPSVPSVPMPTYFSTPTSPIPLEKE